jgi:predicted transcriptional regulator
MTILDNTAAAAGEPDDHVAKLERLRAAIQVGLDEIERGEFEVVTDITAWLDGLGRREG